MSISASSSDQFAQNFLQLSLGRAPNGTESSYWTDIMRAAYAQGQTSMLYGVREFGMTVFESAEYAARNRTDHEYVYDLYKTYLMREPDADGWGFWTSQVPGMGREGVRHAFDGCTEFSNIVTTLTASGTASSAVASLPTAHVDPFNQPGNQLQARDCEWNLPLLSLGGRAGLDLGLGLSYSSAVWTRSGPYIYFDADMGLPSPGFKLGFPTIRGPFFDAQVGRNSYLLITGSARTELRQVSTTNIYESADSSYLQLTVGGSLTLRSTDGTVMSYAAFEDEWHCIGIEDRNGNLISISYDKRDITTITDTLARMLTFNYDAYANLSTITQMWNGQSHTWASFGWSNLTVQPGFSSEVVGTYNGEVIPVLTQIGLADGSRYNFEYATNGQVNVIRRYTFDPTNGYVERSYLAYNYDTPAEDCPRITASRVWAENWTGVNGVPAEVVTSFSDNGDGSHQIISPDGTIYKEIYAGSSQAAWMHGLVTQSVVLSDSTQQKLTATTWTQENTSANYQINPRVIETNIYDANSNRRRTTVDYSPAAYAQYGLPYFVSEYAADGQTEIRRSYNDYNRSQAYLDRRIIGLISARHVYNPSTGEWLSKTTYGYDASGINAQATTAPSHDQNYDASFTPRGNVTSMSRWDVTDIGNAAKALSSQMSYDAAGNLLSTTDPSSHTKSIGYADAFSDGNNSRSTFAYPTTATDADGNSSFIQYNYDFGSKTYIQGPPPGNPGQYSSGIAQTFSYDDAARLLRVTTANTGAYTHYYYGPNYLQSYSSVNTVAANYWESDQYEVEVFDGAGRVFEAASYHPGSQGGYRAVTSVYDAMGRAIKQSNPTEINGSWVPYGDDAAGWVYTQQTYDWKGRPLETRHLTDGSVKYASYAGCGCAGGEMVTLTDEMGRQQKVYSDSLGRQWKTEVLNSDSSVYSTSETTLNGRDQATLVRQFQGNDQSGVYQNTTMDYDGYGRLQRKHTPEQDAGTSTLYAYNPDDTIGSVTDARGATCTYGYNNRHEMTSATHTLSGQPTIALGFGYDAAGNRTSMTDPQGSSSYSYDQLSRMSSETRMLPVGSYTLNYGYNLAGELTSLNDQAFGTSLTYSYDVAGRLNSLSGTGYPNVLQFASNVQYRAWGAIKAMNYGNGQTLAMGFNSRLLPTTYQVPNVANKTYQYDADAKLDYSHDLYDPRYDRKNLYDQAGRIQTALSGAEARGEGTTADRPYNQTFGYDAFNNLTARTSYQWSLAFGTDSSTYTNNRHEGWHYDAAGNFLDDGTFNALQDKYDAAGHLTQIVHPAFPSNPKRSDDYDGDGQRVRTGYHYVQPEFTFPLTYTYYLHSTVLGGQIIDEISSSGQKMMSYVYDPKGGLVATQKLVTPSDVATYVAWNQTDPSGASVRLSNTTGNLVTNLSAELDATGGDNELGDPAINPPPAGPPDENSPAFGSFGNPSRPSRGCTFNNIPLPDCGFILQDVDPFDIQHELMLPHITSYDVDTHDGIQHFGLDRAGAYAEANRLHGTLIRNWIVSSDWTGDLSTLGQQPQHALAKDIEAATNKVKGDKYCRDALNKLLSLTIQDARAQGILIIEGGGVNINDGLSRLSTTNVVYTGKSGVTIDGSTETVNDLSVDLFGPNLYVNKSYGSRKPEERMFAILHEALHMFSAFTDQALAMAAQRASGVKEKDIKDYSFDNKGRQAASLRLNEYILSNCQGLKVDTGTTIRLAP